MKKRQKETKRFESTEIKQGAFVNEDYKMVRTFIIILIIVLALVGLLFYFNGRIVTKDMLDKTTTTTLATFDDTIILADNIFKQNDEKYMVLFYDSSDKTTEVLYGGLFNTYRGTTSLYAVDLANKMNKAHYNEKQEKENTTPKDASEVVVSGPTLITIKKGKVTSYIKDRESITEELRYKEK